VADIEPDRIITLDTVTESVLTDCDADRRDVGHRPHRSGRRSRSMVPTPIAATARV
jgi:hypothetical protein